MVSLWYSHLMSKGASKTKTKIRKAVIPVAGFGTRFLPATIAQPKEMLTVVDKPVIQYIVEELVAAGIEEIVFVTGRNKRAIEDHFDYSSELEQSLRDGGKLDLLKEVHRISRLAKFVYVRQNKMLGNGDALLTAKEVIGDEPFALSFGDDIVEAKVPAMKQMIATYEQYGGSVIGTMPIDKNLVHRYGILAPDGEINGSSFKVKDTVEKPTVEEAPSNYMVSGRYILTPDIFEKLEHTKPHSSGELYLIDAVQAMAHEGNVYAHILDGIYFDCGNKLEYVKANIHFALERSDLAPDVRAFIERLS